MGPVDQGTSGRWPSFTFHLALSRQLQAGVGLILVLVILGAMFLGMRALVHAPVLIDASGLPLSEEDVRNIQRIEDRNLPGVFLYRLPEFFSLEDESSWWEMHRAVSGLLLQKERVRVERQDRHGAIFHEQYRVGNTDAIGLVRSVGLIYFVALLFIPGAISVFLKHDTPAAAVLALFFLIASLYFTTAAPIVGRTLTLLFPDFSMLVKLHYLAAGGLIAIVHYALIFPTPKRTLERMPLLVPAVLYGYVLLVTILYWGGIISFAATTPCLVFWTLVMIGGFAHSLIVEKDRFLRKQLGLNLFVPIIVAVLFILINTLPGVLGTTSLQFTFFGLISLIIPFALSAALDNYYLYKQRVEVEVRANLEREKLREDLHDDALNKLANITLLSDAALNTLEGGHGSEQARSRLQTIKVQAADYSRQIRRLLWISDERYQTWEDLNSQLRSHGYDMVDGHDIDFEIAMSATGHGQMPVSSLSVKVALYRIFSEAISNAVRHSGAVRIDSHLSVELSSVTLEIRDNGSGFQPDTPAPGHYGLETMRRRAEELGGSVEFDSQPGHGTRVRAMIPFSSVYRS